MQRAGRGASRSLLSVTVTGVYCFSMLQFFAIVGIFTVTTLILWFSSTLMQDEVVLEGEPVATSTTDVSTSSVAISEEATSSTTERPDEEPKIVPSPAPIPEPTPTPVPAPLPKPVPKPVPEPSPIPAPEPEEGDGMFIRTVGQREGSFLIQAVLPDKVEGLWFEAYPVAREEGVPRTIRVGDNIGYACEGISIRVMWIDSVRGRVTFEKKTTETSNATCPICLSVETRIDTPSGQVPVTELAVGSPVWTVDSNGERVETTVAQIGSTFAPVGHRMVFLQLEDGRELSVSPGHPTVDGRMVGELERGDTYDGSRVESVRRVLYGAESTYDILPSGETGLYFANGVLLGSTLVSERE